MSMLNEFAKMLVKSTEDELEKLSKFIEEMEQTVKDIEVSNTFTYSELNKFDDPIRKKFDGYLKTSNAIELICIYLVHDQFTNCTSNKPCTDYYAPTCDRKVAMLNSIQEVKDTIMVNAPYEMWCKYFI